MWEVSWENVAVVKLREDEGLDQMREVKTEVSGVFGG